MRLFLAFRAFFSVLFRRDIADQVRISLENKSIDIGQEKSDMKSLETTAPTKPPTLPKSKSSTRSEALTLLSALQREARLMDLICEPLDQYNDAQIGAAARDVLRDSKKTLDRLFGIQHLSQSEEGTSIEIPSQPSPVRWRIIGKESHRGTISHLGWQATKIEMPQWTGNAEDALVISATEVET